MITYIVFFSTLFSQGVIRRHHKNNFIEHNHTHLHLFPKLKFHKHDHKHTSSIFDHNHQHTIYEEIIPISLPTLVKACIALSKCSSFIAADICTRILALPLGTTGK